MSEDCRMCGGKGEIEAVMEDGLTDMVPCPNCIHGERAMLMANGYVRINPNAQFSASGNPILGVVVIHVDSVSYALDMDKARSFLLMVQQAVMIAERKEQSDEQR